MAFTPYQQARIQAAITERLAHTPCPLCRNQSWSLSDEPVMLALSDNPGGITGSGSTLPTVVITCTNCGNTHLLNMMVLGLGDLLTASSHPVGGESVKSGAMSR